MDSTLYSLFYRYGIYVNIYLNTVFIMVTMSRGMIDITSKDFVYREARARGKIILRPETIEMIKRGSIDKGDVIESSKVAAINAVKNTPYILPYCHPIKITGIDIDHILNRDYIEMSVTVKSIEQTGVEMDALTGLMAGLLCIWDMVKKYEKDEEGNYPTTKIVDVHVEYKRKEIVK